MSEPRKLSAQDCQRMNLPVEYWQSRLDKVPVSVAAPVAKYCRNIDEMVRDGLGFVLSGPPGVGKTAIASIFARTARSHRHPALFVAIADLREMIRTRAVFEEATTVYDRCRSVAFLVLDGLRAEDASDHVVNDTLLDGLLSGRTASKLSTIITTRLDPSKLRNAFPNMMEAIRSSAVILTVQGPDLRESIQEDLRKKLLGKP